MEKMCSIYISTLDIDSNDKELIKRICYKFCCCLYIHDFEFKHSTSKGCHFILKCYIECDKCRLVFDDFRRFAYDQYRPEWAKNILFNKKEFLKNATNRKIL